MVGEDLRWLLTLTCDDGICGDWRGAALARAQELAYSFHRVEGQDIGLNRRLPGMSQRVIGLSDVTRINNLQAERCPKQRVQ